MTSEVEVILTSESFVFDPLELDVVEGENRHDEPEEHGRAGTEMNRLSGQKKESVGHCEKTQIPRTSVGQYTADGDAHLYDADEISKAPSVSSSSSFSFEPQKKYLEKGFGNLWTAGQQKFGNIMTSTSFPTSLHQNENHGEDKAEERDHPLERWDYYKVDKDTLRQQIFSLEAKIKDQGAILSRTHSELRRTKDENISLTLTTNELEKMIIERDKKHRSEVDEVRQTREILKRKFSVQEKEVSDLTSKVKKNEINKKVSGKDSTDENTREKFDELFRQNHVLRALMVKKNAAHEKAVRMLKKSQKENVSLADTVTKIRQEKNMYHGTMESYQVKCSQAQAQMRAQSESHEKQVNELTCQDEAVRNENSTLKEKMSIQEQRLKKYTKQLDIYNGQLNRVFDGQLKSSSYSQSITELVDDFFDMRFKLDEYSRNLLSRNKEIDEINQDREAWKAASNETIKELMIERDHLKNRNSEPLQSYEVGIIDETVEMGEPKDDNRIETTKKNAIEVKTELRDKIDNTFQFLLSRASELEQILGAKDNSWECKQETILEEIEAQRDWVEKERQLVESTLDECLDYFSIDSKKHELRMCSSEDAVDSLTKKNNFHEEENVKLNEKLEEYNEFLSKRDTEADQLMQDISNIKSDHKQKIKEHVLINEELRGENNYLNKHMKSYLSKFAVLSSEFQHLKQGHEVLKSGSSKTIRELTLKNEMHERVEANMMQKLKNHMNQLSFMNSECDSLLQRVGSLTGANVGALKNLTHKLFTLREENVDMRKWLNDTNIELCARTARLNKLNNNHEELKETYETMKKHNFVHLVHIGLAHTIQFLHFRFLWQPIAGIARVMGKNVAKMIHQNGQMRLEDRKKRVVTQHGADSAVAEISDFFGVEGAQAAAPVSSLPPVSESEKNGIRRGNTTAGNVPTKDHLKKDPELARYLSMTNVGVPPEAVAHKMIMDGLSPSQIQMFKFVFGIPFETEDDPNSSFLPSGRTKVKMRNIHWKAVVDKDKLQDSIWKDSSTTDNAIDQSEIKQLEVLFAKPLNNEKRKKAQEAPEKGKKKNTSESKKVLHLEILLVQFQSFATYEDLCNAVIRQDTMSLTAENLLNLQSLLNEKPTVAKKEHEDLMGSVDLFFSTVSKIPRFHQKLDSFIFMRTFKNKSDELMKIVETLDKAYIEIMQSQTLTLLLKRLLAVGNLMNESIGKENVEGITYDSLLETANKRSSDGEINLLDHVVSTILKNQDFGEKNLDLRTEMPTLEKAKKIDIRDSQTQLHSLCRDLNALRDFTELEKKEISSQIGYTESLAQFVEKSEQFSGSSSDVLLNISIKLRDAEGSASFMCSFFAEDSNISQSNSIVKVLIQFSELVERSNKFWITKNKIKRSSKRSIKSLPQCSSTELNVDLRNSLLHAIGAKKKAPIDDHPLNISLEPKRHSVKTDSRSSLLHAIVLKGKRSTSKKPLVSEKPKFDLNGLDSRNALMHAIVSKRKTSKGAQSDSANSHVTKLWKDMPSDACTSLKSDLPDKDSRGKLLDAIVSRGKTSKDTSSDTCNSSKGEMPKKDSRSSLLDAIVNRGNSSKDIPPDTCNSPRAESPDENSSTAFQRDTEAKRNAPTNSFCRTDVVGNGELSTILEAISEESSGFDDCRNDSEENGAHN